METFIVVLLGFVIGVVIIRQIGKQKEEDNEGAIEKQIAFFDQVPEGKQYVFVDANTYIWLICPETFLSVDMLPADLRVLRPGVIGYMYGYGIIVDEELAGTYL